MIQQRASHEGVLPARQLLAQQRAYERSQTKLDGEPIRIRKIASIARGKPDHTPTASYEDFRRSVKDESK